MIRKLILIISLTISIFTLYTAIFGLLTPVLQRGVHVGLILVLGLLVFPVKKEAKALRIIDFLAILFVISSIVYLYFSYGTLMHRIGYENIWDNLFGGIFILLLLEMCRRIVGLPLTIIAGIFLAYGFWGNLVPGFFGHEGYDLSRMITTMFLTTEGIFGSAAGAAATFVAMFIIFGTFLEKSGASQIFINLATAVGGKRRGGPAKIAVFASALTGSVNGSPVANVTTTGVFTIPLMRKVGYTKNVSGAVEAVASTGGSILPPIMGAGAFVMAELTGLSYASIALAAIIPAILYYASIYFVVDFEAAKKNLRGLKEDELPNLKEALKKSFIVAIPLIVLIISIAVLQVSITRSALYSILSIIILSLIRRKINIKLFIEILEVSAKRMLLVSVACATAGLVVGVITLSGLGLKLAGTLMTLGQDSLFLTLLLTAVGAIIIGMGLPPTPSYIIFSVLTAPALIELGIPVLAAHLFVFYFTCLAPVTPPVALAAYTAAGISEGKPMQTAFYAGYFALPAFLVPFMFIYGPELLMDGSFLEILISFSTAVIGVISFAGGIIGWFMKPISWYLRVLMFGAGFALIIPSTIGAVIGIILLATVVILIKYVIKDKAAEEQIMNA
ncbi:TRAP transporter permease [Oceanobacillus jeddahense]|uniref:TRAP transporter fused permease subunit n=1 Tax=Oceanobacillus jeddahense TaxID=1462527 RepID=A0ABY5JSM0_9BACI|nr:TRAP transporter fused permease subunit [Oceanobacillus jeddahense]UUI02442.1 TRAP transporter fused permease subunit [Oceanobacillus jeddahense]